MDSKESTRTTLEAISLWSETTMQVWRQMLDCAAGTARESVHLATELQTSAVEALQQSQTCMLQHLRELPEMPKQPLDYYQKSLGTCLETSEQFYKLSMGNAQVMLRSAEQVGILAQQAMSKLHGSYRECADKLKTLYTPA